jgi:DNA-binding MarR family transcriptional regulator
MRLHDMYSQPGYLIRRLHQRSTAEFASAAGAFGITQVQLSILLAVAEYPNTDATRISELIGSDRATIGQALLRLEQKRLVRRRTGSSDKRTKRLAITTDGGALIDAVANVVPSVADRLFTGLSPEEHETFMALLTKIISSNEGGSAVGHADAAEPAG